MERSFVEDLFNRVTALEKRERNYAHEIQDVRQENNDLRKKVESSEKKYKKLQKRLDIVETMGNAGGGSTENPSTNTVMKLKQRCDTLQTIVRNLQRQVDEFDQRWQTVEHLDKMTKVLNRAMVQGHQESPPPLPVTKDMLKEKHLLKTRVADLEKWKQEETTKDNQMLERIRSVARQTASIDAIQDELSLLTSWREKKMEEDVKKSKQLEENMKKINNNFSAVKESLQERPKETTVSTVTDVGKKVQIQHEQTIDSIFCADLGTHQDLVTNHALKVTKCAAALRSATGPFDSDSGTFKPCHEGVYNLGWKIHQKGDGKIRFIMAIDGMKGRIYLGSTDEAGAQCSGTLIMPLKTQQRVWIEAKRVRGPDAEVYGCNFMGWLMEINNSLGPLDKIASLQQNLFSSIVNECQHL